jgi:gas vesicle protein
MSNVWKGLVFGALVGAAVGLVLDLLNRAGKGAVAVAEMAREHGPDIAASVATAAKAGAERLRDADLAEKLRQAAHTAAASDAAQTVRDSAESAFNSAASAVKDAAAATTAAAADATRRQRR